MENEKLKELARAVKEMRQKQNDYFSWKGINPIIRKGMLSYAKQCEAKVDKLVKNILEGQPGELF